MAACLSGGGEPAKETNAVEDRLRIEAVRRLLQEQESAETRGQLRTKGKTFARASESLQAECEYSERQIKESGTEL